MKNSCLNVFNSGNIFKRDEEWGITLKKGLLFFIIIAIFVTLSACGSTSSQPELEEDRTEANYPKSEYSKDDNPIVTITMEDDREIIIELFPEIAPNTVANFISLIEANFYDGLTFHRVIPNFMIQGGDPLGTGIGGPNYTIKGEFANNGFENPLKHERGVVSMARALDPNSAGSQFFIMVEEHSSLDGNYAAFGKVLTGLEVVDDIVHAERDANDKPLADQKMKTVVVDTKGIDYPEPEVME